MGYCVKDRVHPSVVTVQVNITTGGTLSLLSIDPSPRSDVYSCISSAAYKIKIDPPPAQNKVESYPLLLPYPYFPVGSGWGEITTTSWVMLAARGFSRPL